MHGEYVRLVPDADTAVLFIHGICGTPNHFREPIPLQEAVPEVLSVYNVLLDGHGGTAADFAGTSGKKWHEQIRSAYDRLARCHDRIYIVGHSMGTLFALQLAADHPEKVKKLFLLAVPMRPWLKLRMIGDLLLLTFENSDQAPLHRQALIKASGIRTTRKLWQYVPWIPRFLELFLEIGRTEPVIPGVTAECICLQSQKDELVLRRSERILKRNDGFRILRLNHSSHFYYPEEDKCTILQEFQNWINGKSHD